MKLNVLDNYIDNNGNKVKITANENAPIIMTEEEIVQANLVLKVAKLEILQELNGGI